MGDRVRLFNAQDGEWLAQVEMLGKNRGEARCLEQLRPPQPEPGPWLAFAPIKKDRLDMIVEKAVELGVEKLIPVITRRTENRRLKMERLHQHVIEAAEQCERLSLPEVGEPVQVDKLKTLWPAERTLLVGAERREALPLATALKGQGQCVGVLIGPEGGFEDKELDDVLNLPFSVAVNLGPRILRAETAATAALSIIQALSGDWTKQT